VNIQESFDLGTKSNRTEKLLCKQTKQKATNCSNSIIHSECVSKKSFDVFPCYYQ
ncbi:hypothetical protein H311_02053, partial [Anncaliia algerae PRA109]